MSLPAVLPSYLPAEYHETPASYLARQLDQVDSVSPELQAELRAVLAGLRITTSKAEVEALEARLRRLNQLQPATDDPLARAGRNPIYEN